MDVAYENPSGAALNFNFWMDKNNGIDPTPFLQDSDITQAIRDLIQGRVPKFLSSRQRGNGSVLVVALHSIDLDMLEWLLPKIPFLHQQCSYMPIRHMNTMTALSARNRKSIPPSSNNSSSNKNYNSGGRISGAAGTQQNLLPQQRQFQYMEVDSMNSLILWPEKTPVRENELKAMTVSDLFRNHKVILKGTHTDWTDEIVFLSSNNIYKSSGYKVNREGYNCFSTSTSSATPPPTADPLRIALDQKKAVLAMADNKAVETYLHEIECYLAQSETHSDITVDGNSCKRSVTQLNGCVDEGSATAGLVSSSRSLLHTVPVPVTGIFRCISGEQGCFILVHGNVPNEPTASAAATAAAPSGTNSSSHRLYLVWDRWDIDCLMIRNNDHDEEVEDNDVSEVPPGSSILDMLLLSSRQRPEKTNSSKNSRKNNDDEDDDEEQKKRKQLEEEERESSASPALRFVKLVSPSPTSGYTMDKKELILSYIRSYAISVHDTNSTAAATTSTTTAATTTTTAATATANIIADSKASDVSIRVETQSMLSLLHSKVRAVQAAYGIPESTPSSSSFNSSSNTSCSKTAELFSSLQLSADLLVMMGYMLFAPDEVVASEDDTDYVPYLSTYSEDWGNKTVETPNSSSYNNFNNDGGAHDDVLESAVRQEEEEEATSNWAQHKQKYTTLDDESGLEDGEEEEEEKEEQYLDNNSNNTNENSWGSSNLSVAGGTKSSHSRGEEEVESKELLPAAKRSRVESPSCSCNTESAKGNTHTPPESGALATAVAAPPSVVIAVCGSSSSSSSNSNSRNSTSTSASSTGIGSSIRDQKLQGVKEGYLSENKNKGPLSVCAIDCEMCLTAAGYELTRLTVVSLQAIELDILVKPSRPIVDYNTEFSGITYECLETVTTTICDAREALQRLVSADTTIVGHSLDSDLNALRIVHGKVIDTAALFPHPKGVPFKHSLKKLAKDVLRINVQDSEDGHDSAEDAIVALLLALTKLENEAESNGLSSVNQSLTTANTIPTTTNTTTSIDCSLVQLPTISIPVNGAVELDAVEREPLFSTLKRSSQQEYEEGNVDTGGGGGEDVVDVVVDVNRRPLTVVLHSCAVHATRPQWEQHSLGYSLDSDCCSSAAAAIQASIVYRPGNILAKRHLYSSEAADECVADLRQLKREDTSCINEQRFVGWVDLVCEFTSGGECDIDDVEAEAAAAAAVAGGIRSGSNNTSLRLIDKERAASNITSAVQLNKQLLALSEAAEVGTTILVVTQGNLTDVKQFSGRKQRYRWEQNILKKHSMQTDTAKHRSKDGSSSSDYTSSTTTARAAIIKHTTAKGRTDTGSNSNTVWSSQKDEAALIEAAARAIRGGVFVTIKQ